MTFCPGSHPLRRVSRQAAAISLLAGCLTACSDGNAPTPPPPAGGSDFTAAVMVTYLSSPFYDATTDGIAVIGCSITLSAKGQGSGTGSWGGAVFRFFPTNDVHTPFDSVGFTAKEVADSWEGNATISDGETQISGWRFGATIPFMVELRFRYRPVGASSDSTTSVQFTCQPPIPANATSPEIDSLIVQPAGGMVEPGDTISVSYGVIAPAGLWQTVLELTGACDTLLFAPGQLAQSRSFTFRLPLPRGCPLGSSFGVSVRVLDAALHLVQIPRLQYTVTDHTPPQLSVSFGGGAPAVSGDFFTGDTLNFEVSATDNDEVSSLTWEVLPSGITGSAPPSAIRNPPFFPVLVGAAWGTVTQIKFSATDRSGNRSAYTTLSTDSLRLHPVVSRVRAVRTLAGEIRQILPDRKRGVFYVLLGNEQQLLTLSLNDASIVRTLNLPSCGTSFDLTASGDSLLFTCPVTANLGVLDLATPVPQFSVHPLTTPDTLDGQWPGKVFGVANGKAFIGLAGPAASQAGVLEVDLATGTESLRPDVGGAFSPIHFIERSPKHDRILAGDGTGRVQVYSSATDQFGPLAMPPDNGGQFWWSADNQVFVEGMAILDQSLQQVGSVRNLVGGGAVASALTPDGRSLFYGTNQGLVRTRLSDGEVVDRSSEQVWIRDMRITDDGLQAVYTYFESSSAGQVGVLDLR